MNTGSVRFIFCLLHFKLGKLNTSIIILLYGTCAAHHASQLDQSVSNAKYSFTSTSLAYPLRPIFFHALSMSTSKT